MDESARVRVGYVPNAKAETGYDLYAFGNGSPNVLTRLGWKPGSLAQARKSWSKYWPLKDDATGGHFLKATHGAGDVLYGAGGPKRGQGERR